MNQLASLLDPLANSKCLGGFTIETNPCSGICEEE
jgi:hypothetical protein